MNGRPSLLAGATLFEVAPAHVDEGDRIGFLHEDKAAALGRLMAVDGQRDPIKVVANKKNPEKPWRLVTGMHRLIGARIECIPVWAIEVKSGADDLSDLEASENRHRRSFRPLERAKFTAALVNAAKARLAREHGDLKQQQMAVRTRWERVKAKELKAEKALSDEVDDTCRISRRVYGWEESVAKALDMGRDAIYDDLKLNRLLIEPFGSMMAALDAHPVVGGSRKQLLSLASKDHDGIRRRAVELLLENPDMDAATAVERAMPDAPPSRAPTPFEKFTGQVVAGWSRLGIEGKRRFIESDEFLRLFSSDDLLERALARLAREQSHD